MQVRQQYFVEMREQFEEIKRTIFKGKQNFKNQFILIRMNYIAKE